MLSNAQKAEIDKYSNAYQHPNYRMGMARKQCAQANLQSVPYRDGYVDVGCGRGEMLDFARSVGYQRVTGVEPTPCLNRRDDVIDAVAWDMPFSDGAFDVVSLFDVIEHILPEDAEKTCLELLRVARKVIFITAANYSSKSLGVELHVNRMPYEVWDTFFKDVFTGDVIWLPRPQGMNSETWQINLA